MQRFWEASQHRLAVAARKDIKAKLRISRQNLGHHRSQVLDSFASDPRTGIRNAMFFLLDERHREVLIIQTWFDDRGSFRLEDLVLDDVLAIQLTPGDKRVRVDERCA